MNITAFSKNFTNNRILTNLFVSKYYLKMGISKFQISDGDTLWMWARETLIPGLYSTKWYNEKKIGEGWLANKEDYLVGVPRLRLLRVEQGG